MQLSADDPYVESTLFSGFDPRAKLIGTLAFILGLAFLMQPLLLVTALVFVLLLLSISRVPGQIILKRFSMALPFIVLASASLYLASTSGAAFAMFLRISASVLALILLSSTTGFFDILWGLQKLRMPQIMVTLLMFTYRYIFVFGEELARMRMARRAKHFRSGASIRDRKTMVVVSNTIGMVLIRAYERGLKVHLALKARAFDGVVRRQGGMRFTAPDYGMCASFIMMAGLLLYLEWMVMA